MQLSCILVDDSITHREAISKLLNRQPALHLIQTFGSPKEARSYLKKNEVDLVFLDIEMPGMSGFQLLDRLKNPPMVIIISAHGKHALKAFDYEVIDFLQKPVLPERLSVSVQRALTQLRYVTSEELEDNFITVKTDYKKKTRINCDQIEWVEAMGDYIRLVTSNAKFMVLSSLKAFEKELPEEQFLRVHKSFIVNLVKIERYNNSVIEIKGHKLPLSRRRKGALDEALKNI
ncbi:LytTR family DNA-binding domain-containing protein [Zeaxanthinibacter sp. PT1]|uniref:LytR/AlgR family response regulator transcription factor n=1 Tax=Zeaxanthinibacter TaxID=561554 RepID=UPI00234AF009|nr:LytTR family DNA-binding domain-containing protein [Zeaxanthinibacter sp. PT1]MDC6352069.1 LytTR family DNA-binding domain-containing protein [Zeaxanthinibacter sp. PT1]